MPPNPLARQRRLGAALLNLRTERGYSHAKLAGISGVSGSVISRLENPIGEPHRRPGIRPVRQLLDALGVPRGSAQFALIDGFAEDAGGSRWWDSHPRMGDGQKTFALVETEASQILDYAGMLLPGLVQTEAYARHRAMITGGSPAVDPEAIVAGRLARQRILDDPGMSYRLIMEEQAVRRCPVPRPVMTAQLEHLLALAERPNVSIRIVPVDADLGDGFAPRAPYAHVTYPDRDDPTIVIVDNVTRALLVTEPDEANGYAQLHRRLSEAALSDVDSVELISELVGKPATQ